MRRRIDTRRSITLTLLTRAGTRATDLSSLADVTRFVLLRLLALASVVQPAGAARELPVGGIADGLGVLR